MRLRGARLVTASEQDEAARLDEALIKQITGGDPLTARDTYERPITFRPTFKLWLAVNHRPKVVETGHGMWRRVRLIPFDYRVAEDKRDPDLDSKLRAELPGILNWMLSGTAEWLKDGSAHRPQPAL